MHGVETARERERVRRWMSSLLTCDDDSDGETNFFQL